MVFTTATVLWVSAVNVRYRDVQYLVGLGLLVWFWMTPIVYQGGLVQQRLTSATAAFTPHLFQVYLLNPLTPIIAGFQRALYATVQPRGIPVLFDVSVAWLAGVIALVLAASTVLLYLTWRLFFKLSGDFAEQL